MPPAAPPEPPAARLPLTQQRCWNHAEREAAARCPACGRFFCRECVTEHAGRMVCAACLRDLLAAGTRPRPGAAGGRAGRVARTAAIGAGKALLAVAGVAAAWLYFHLMAQQLIELPTAFHEGTFWEKAMLGEDAP